MKKITTIRVSTIMEIIERKNIVLFVKDELLVESLTPLDPEKRGAQISLKFSKDVEKVHEQLEKRGVVVIIIYYFISFQVKN